MESLTDISARAVVRRLRKFCHVWNLEIPRELRNILINAGIKRNKKIRKLQQRYQNNKHLTQYMEEKLQEYNERVRQWEQLVKTREENVKQREKQWEKIKKMLKAKKRLSLILAKHLQIERKTWREINKMKLKRKMLQVKRAALDEARNDLSNVKESNCEMREILNRMKENVEEDYRKLRHATKIV